MLKFKSPHICMPPNNKTAIIICDISVDTGPLRIITGKRYHDMNLEYDWMFVRDVHIRCIKPGPIVSDLSHIIGYCNIIVKDGFVATRRVLIAETEEEMIQYQLMYPTSFTRDNITDYGWQL